MDNQTSSPVDQAASPPHADDGRDRAAASRVRRRNRMITSCLECRRRKLKCDKQQPCTNCNKFSRECVFLAPALDSVSQKKLNELKEKMGTLERSLEDDVARRASESKRGVRRTSSADLPGEGSESDEGPVPEDEKGLEPTPLATVDATYDDADINDDVLDLGFRVGKFRMTERLGGLFRPKIAEEMVFALVRDNKRGTEPEAPLKDDSTTFLDPSPHFIAPGSGFMFGEIGGRRSIIDFLPTKNAADLLMKRYHINCHFLARVVHWPTFQMRYDTFWSSVLAGIEPSASLQALVFAVCFSAVASMSYSEVDAVFHQPHRQVLINFQQATEVALGKGHFLRTTKFETLQALIVYLIPMCRGECSRAHSVLVGAAIRLGECFSLHRDPVETFGHSPIDAHVRRLAWFQLCYLDFRTVEAQGPRPSIKREDYDTKLPWNLDDEDLLDIQPQSGQQTIDLREKEGQWTDITLSKIRFECNEMHRIVWHDRVRLDKQKVSITHCLSKIESFRSAMEGKYAWLDTSITIQHYARILLDLLLLRMHIMILHKFHNATSTRIPDRLRQIIINSGTKLSESAVRLDIDPKFECFRWYSTALQQWHTAFLLLVEVFVFPNRKEAERVWSIVDHVFEPNLTLPRVQKARSILGAFRDRANAYRDVRKMREPISMQGRLNTNLPARARIRGPDMILPPEEAAQQATQGQHRASTYARQSQYTTNAPTTTVQAPTPAPATSNKDPSDWNFDSPYTLFVGKNKNAVAEALANQVHLSAHTSPQYTGIQHPGEPSPSNSSHLTESWPPNFANVQQATYQYNANTTSPHQQNLSSPELSNSPQPPGMYGNTAMGLVSGQYIPNQNTTPATSNLTYSSGSPSVAGPMSPEPSTNQYTQGSNSAANLAMMGMIGSGQTDMPHNETQPPAAWGPTQAMPNQQDLPMLDIDWTEWDKLFPVEMNNGELDLPMDTRQSVQ